MKIELKLQDIGARLSDSVAEIIDSAANFIMDNFFPEFEESEVFNRYDAVEINLQEETVCLQINPVWLRQAQH